jgi:prepilin-type N-terminal cleavage/methylation domain-containing protein/prepilin-type processing-associated H-X9-DG protein
MRNRAFTLIELLVVVGIVSVLIAILLPVLSKARSQATRVACQANLSEINKALQTYLNDNRSWLPAGIKVPGGHQYSGYTYFARYLEKGAAIQRTFVCPADVDRVDGDEISFCVNEATFEEQDNPRPIKLSQIHNKSELLYLRDWWTRQDERSFTSLVLPWSQDCWPHYRRIYLEYSAVHGGGFNGLFVDGHVEWIAKPKNKSELIDEETRWPSRRIRTALSW